MAHSEPKTSAPPLKRPLPRLFAAQFFALALGLVVMRFTELPLVSIFLVQGALAALLTRLAGLRGGWLLLQAVVPVSVWGLLILQLPSWAYGLAFVLTVLVFWNSADERVPLYLSNPTTRLALERLLPHKQGPRFVDLGCGLGGPTMALANLRPDGTFHGVESAPGPYAVARVRQALFRQNNAGFIYGSIWDVDLSRYDMVYAFLSPAPMARLHAKVKAEMQPGSVFVSNSFAVPDVEADEVQVLEDRRGTRLLIWRL